MGLFELESADYRTARAALLQEELAVRDHVERLAAMRRALPPGPRVMDRVVFREGPGDLSRNAPSDHFETALDELFTDPARSLILVHFMYAPGDAQPCPMCSMWADGYSGVVEHITRRANFAVVAKADVGAFREWGRSRGWTGLRLLSSGGTTFNRDIGMEDESGAQSPGASVFTRAADGTVRLAFTGSAMLADDEYRGMDLLSPVWNFFDLLPDGRGDWMPSAD